MGRKFVTKRAFSTKCKYCGKPVLFWEAESGQKAFFNLPVYGKPQRHICNQYLASKQVNVSKWRTAKEERQKISPYDVDELEVYECPVCAKIFKHENNLNAHIHQMKKTDDDHQIFFKSILNGVEFMSENSEENYKKTHDVKTQATFGKVVLRKKKGKN